MSEAEDRVEQAIERLEIAFFGATRWHGSVLVTDEDEPDYADAREAFLAMWREQQEQLNEARRELNDISRAYAPVGVYFMDPPDGGSVTFAEQVGRLVADWQALRESAAMDAVPLQPGDVREGR